MADDAPAASSRKSPRRKRDPGGTRTAILEAAGIQLAKDGPEGLSVSQVAQLAGVNRGTAYQHFQTREQLVDATTDWVSRKMREAVFGDATAKAGGNGAGDMNDPEFVAEHLAQFAMDNPELGRAWLFEVLSSSRPASDPFWNEYKTNFEKFAQSEYAQPGIDTEVMAVLTVIGAFLWPVWARAQSRTAKERQQMAKRFSDELLRLSLYGTMRPDKFKELDARFSKGIHGRKKEE
jgi:AcrR family transcriptional regulator